MAGATASFLFPQSLWAQEYSRSGLVLSEDDDVHDFPVAQLLSILGAISETISETLFNQEITDVDSAVFYPKLGLHARLRAYL